MTPLEVHVSVSPSHAHLVERHLEPTFVETARDDARLVLHETPQHSPTGRFFEEGWGDQVREKLVAAAAAAHDAADGAALAFCDADVAFLAPWAEPALSALDGHDVVLMTEPEFSPAFWLAHATPRLRAMLDDRLERWGEWRSDGPALLDGIASYGLDASPLDKRFANPGNLGHPLPLVFGHATFTPPAETLLFHANFCLLEDKDTLLAEMRRLASGGERIPNHELVATGPEGHGFFPSRCPDRPFDRQSMFARDKARDVLSFVGDRPVALIVEVGSWLGASTRWFAETFAGSRHTGEGQEQAQIICIDPWTGLAEWSGSELAARTPNAWEQFVVNCWHLRQWITPVRLRSEEGLPQITAELERQGRAPDLVFIDGDHRYDACRHDVLASARAWPGALVLGGAYGFASGDGDRELPVREAVEDAAAELGRKVEVGSSGVWALSAPA